MSDLDLINWHQVARAVIVADYSLRHDKGYRVEPSEAAKEVAQRCMDEYRDGKRLEEGGFTFVGGFWCRIEENKIAPYTRKSAIGRLNKEEQGNAKIS